MVSVIYKSFSLVLMALMGTFLAQFISLSMLHAEPKQTVADNSLPPSPFLNRIWSVARQKYVSLSDLKQDLARKQYVLLGETHDNPAHHQWQAALIQSLITENKKPAIVMEMVGVDQMRKFSLFTSQQNPKAEHMGIALGWKARGWPDWIIYQPIGEVILRNKLKLFPGQASRMMTRHIIKSDLNILPEKSRKIFLLDQALSQELQTDLENNIRAAHCNLLPEKVVPSMANVQRFKDAWMADVMIQAESPDTPVVLIAGSGHVRTDRGVPWYLERRVNIKDVVSLIFHELNPGETTPHKRVLKTHKGKMAANYIWFTDTLKRPDPCQGLEKHFQKK